MFMIYMYVLKIDTITFYYIANLTCIAPFLNGGAIWNSYPFIASTGSPFFKKKNFNSKDYEGLKNIFFTIGKTGKSFPIPESNISFSKFPVSRHLLKLFYDELHSFSTFFAVNFDKKLAVE